MGWKPKNGGGMKGFSKWERIDDYTDRMRIPGGWLIRSWVCNENEDAMGVSLIHIKDSDLTTRWDIK